jgi:hypothetical protein
MTDFSTGFPLLWKKTNQPGKATISWAARLPSENLIVRIARDLASYFSQQCGRNLAHANKHIQQKKHSFENLLHMEKLQY